MKTFLFLFSVLLCIKASSQFEIIGASEIEVGIPHTYTISNVFNKTIISYEWSISGGWSDTGTQQVHTSMNDVHGQQTVNTSTMKIVAGDSQARTTQMISVKIVYQFSPTVTDTIEVFLGLYIFGVRTAEIAGPTWFQSGCNHLVYTAQNYGDANLFLWGIPSGWSMTGQGTNQITVHPNTCTPGPNDVIRCKTKRVNAHPDYYGERVENLGSYYPSAINFTSQPNVVCIDNSSTFSISPICGVSSYQWSFPGNLSHWGLTSEQVNSPNAHTITVNPNSNAQSGNITLTVYFANCSWTMSKTISIAVSPKPTQLLANITSACDGGFSWNSISQALYYEVQKAPTSIGPWTSLGNTSGNVNSMPTSDHPNKAKFYWRVRAMYSCGWGPFSNVSNFTPNYACSNPSYLTISGGTNGAVTVSWNATNNVVKYILQYKVSGTSTWVTIETESNTSIHLNDLLCNTNYKFRVRGECSCGLGLGNWVNESKTTGNPSSCSSPANLSVTNITQTSAKINWGNLVNTKNYIIQYRTNSSYPFLTVANVSAPATSTTLNNLICGTNYEWRMISICNCANSVYTVPQTFTTSPSTTCAIPTGNGTAATSKTSAWVYWTGGNATSYEIQYATSTSGPWSAPIISTTPGNNQITNLECGTTYFWRVRAKCLCGYSGYSTILSFNTQSSTPCPTATSLYTNNITESSATLNWTTNGIALNRVIEVSTINTFPSNQTTSYNVNSNYTYNITGLECMTNYYWRVKTNCECILLPTTSSFGQFTTSQEISCPLPSDVSSLQNSPTSVWLRWSLTDYNHGYTVRYSKNPSLYGWSYKTYSAHDSYSDIINNHRLDGLECGTTYTWSVKTNCSCNESTYYSPNSQFTTSDIDYCSDPTGLGVSGLGVTDVSLFWNPVPGAINYHLERWNSALSIWVPIATSTANYKTITSLADNTNYTLRVKANCFCVGSSSYSIVSFTTALNPLMPRNPENDVPEYLPSTNLNIQHNDLNLYPNPTKDNIWLEYTSSKEGVLNVEIYTIIGTRIDRKRYALISGFNRFALDTYSLPSGIYLIVIEYNGEIKTEKLIKEM